VTGCSAQAETAFALTRRRSSYSSLHAFFFFGALNSWNESNYIQDIEIMTDPESEKYKQRLTDKVEVDPQTDCWLFTGAIASNGYGHISYRGRDEYAHRLAAVLYLNYVLDSPLYVLHLCDTPPCCNPEHLVIGTQKDNMRQAAERGRMGAYKLNTTQVGHIKYSLTKGATYRELATKYDVSTTAIGQIANGITWKDTPPLPTDDTPSTETSDG
jgi:hypothetical protein